MDCYHTEKLYVTLEEEKRAARSRRRVRVHLQYFTLAI
jgi:hypothetical protein